MWGGSLLSAMWSVCLLVSVCAPACHVTTRIIQVLLSGAIENCPLPLSTNSLFRKWEEEKITDQRRTNSLTSSSCLSTFRTSCVFSSEREKKQQHIDQPTEEQRFMTTTQLPHNRGRDGGERDRKRLGENNTRGHIWRYIYTFSPHDEPTFDVS